MTENDQLEIAWSDWFQVLRSIVSLMEKDDLGSALSSLEGFLHRAADPHIRSDALGFGADLKVRLGDVVGAEDDLKIARSLVGSCYQRYVAELSLGAICELQQRTDEAISWYRAALSTCINARDVSAGTAITRMTRLLPWELLSAHDLELCRKSIERSWAVLDLPGKPCLTDMPSAVLEITAAQTHPRDTHS
jgi:hypothetical protein